MQKKIALLHRYPAEQIKETNAAFPYLKAKGIDVLTFKKFNRVSKYSKFWKGIFWIFYAPMLVVGRGYDVIYCDDSFPFYPIFVKLFSQKSKVIIRIGDLHLMYYYHGLAFKFLHFFEKLTWLIVDGILPISQAMADYISNEVTVKNMTVVLDPVDESDFPIKDNHDGGYVMFHGVLTRNKNLDVLLQAAERLPDIDFLIVGVGSDLKRLERLAPCNVFFSGWVSFKEIYKKIGACSIGVAMRSSNPGNEYVVTSPFIQYGIMGKPCLVTRRKVFGDYPWQFSDVDDLVNGIQNLIGMPEEGAKLREVILNKHQAKKISEEIWSQLQS